MIFYPIHNLIIKTFQTKSQSFILLHHILEHYNLKLNDSLLMIALFNFCFDFEINCSHYLFGNSIFKINSKLDLGTYSRFYFHHFSNDFIGNFYFVMNSE